MILYGCSTSQWSCVFLFALVQVLFANRGDAGEACKNTSPLTVHWEAKKDPLLTRMTVAVQLNNLVTLVVSLNIWWLVMYSMRHHTISGGAALGNLKRCHSSGRILLLIEWWGCYSRFLFHISCLLNSCLHWNLKQKYVEVCFTQISKGHWVLWLTCDQISTNMK